MKIMRSFASILAAIGIAKSAVAAAPMPERLVVLTFDDSVASHATFVAPLLKKHGFGATFFITEGFEFLTDKEHYLTWEQIQKLNAEGFEIGNHTRRHAGVAKQKPEQLAADVEFIEQQCAKYGIPKPVSFCYPGYQTSEAAVKLLRERGYRFARAAEIAWKQGVDLYGAADNRLALGFEYTAKYNLGHDVPYEPYRSIDGKYDYREISKSARGRFAPIYQRIVYHYHGRKGLAMPHSREVAAKGATVGRSGGAHVPWGALMFAELPTPNLRPVPATPASRNP